MIYKDQKWQKLINLLNLMNYFDICKMPCGWSIERDYKSSF